MPPYLPAYTEIEPAEAAAVAANSGGPMAGLALAYAGQPKLGVAVAVGSICVGVGTAFYASQKAVQDQEADHTPAVTPSTEDRQRPPREENMRGVLTFLEAHDELPAEYEDRYTEFLE